MEYLVDPSTDWVSALILSRSPLILLPLYSDPQDQRGKVVANSG
jgi:hypothetical protein